MIIRKLQYLYTIYTSFIYTKFVSVKSGKLLTKSVILVQFSNNCLNTHKQFSKKLFFSYNYNKIEKNKYFIHFCTEKNSKFIILHFH